MPLLVKLAALAAAAWVVCTGPAQCAGYGYHPGPVMHAPPPPPMNYGGNYGGYRPMPNYGGNYGGGSVVQYNPAQIYHYNPNQIYHYNPSQIYRTPQFTYGNYNYRPAPLYRPQSGGYYSGGYGYGGYSSGGYGGYGGGYMAPMRHVYVRYPGRAAMWITLALNAAFPYPSCGTVGAAYGGPCCVQYYDDTADGYQYGY